MLLNKHFGRSQSTNPKKQHKKVRFLDEHLRSQRHQSRLRKSGTKFYSKNPDLTRHKQQNLKKTFIIKRKGGSLKSIPSPKSPMGSFSSVSRLVSHKRRDSGSILAPITAPKKSKFSPKLSNPRPFEQFAQRAMMKSLEAQKVGTPKIRNKISRTPAMRSSKEAHFQVAPDIGSYGSLTGRHREREIYERLITKEKENRKRASNVFLKKGSVQLDKIKGILKNKQEEMDSFNFYSATTSIVGNDGSTVDSPLDVKEGNSKTTKFFRIKDSHYRNSILQNFKAGQGKGEKDAQEGKKKPRMDESELERADRHSMEYALTSMKGLLTKAVDMNKRDIKTTKGGRDRLCSIFSSSKIRRNSENKSLLYVSQT